MCTHIYQFRSVNTKSFILLVWVLLWGEFSHLKYQRGNYRHIYGYLLGPALTSFKNSSANCRLCSSNAFFKNSLSCSWCFWISTSWAKASVQTATSRFCAKSTLFLSKLCLQSRLSWSCPILEGFWEFCLWKFETRYPETSECKLYTKSNFYSGN